MKVRSAALNVFAAVAATALLGAAPASDAPAKKATETVSPYGDRVIPLRQKANEDRAAAGVRAYERRKAIEAARKKGRAAPAKAAGVPAGAKAAAPELGGGAGLRFAAQAILDLALGQVGTIDLYASPNYATSKLPTASCSVSGSPCLQDLDCPGFVAPIANGQWLIPQGETCTGPVLSGGIRKFVNTLPVLCPLGKNDLGQCLPLAVPDTTTFPGSDYYEIGVKDFQEQFHSDLPATTRVRGYYQKNVDPAAEAARGHYLGPVIVATTNRPVRVKMVNELPTGAAGNLFIPVDKTLTGAGLGPDGTPYSQNRATFHLHGGNTPWISDGTQHQWTAPAGDPTHFKKGLTTAYVPDMWYSAAGAPVPQCNGLQTCNVAGATINPGDGAMTFYWPNQQSGRLMFYHDHAYGITRLNVYAGEAAGYLLVNPPDEDALAQASVPGTIGSSAATTDLGHMVPLVIQDKTFVPPAAQLQQQDPTWDSTIWGKEGDVWYPHVYTPNQWPANPDGSGSNPFGRWDYGPWFWPPQQSLVLDGVNRPITKSCTSVAAITATNPTGTTVCPTTPDVSQVPESFLDTMIVNGTAYPTYTVDPAAYRFQILNAAQERNLNLSFFVADASGTEVPMVPAVPHDAASPLPACTASAPVNPVTGIPAGCWPTKWPIDGRMGGVPDPAAAGPQILQIGNESGILPIPALIPPQPIDYEYNRRNIVVLNVKSRGLFVGPAERADIVVDFSAYAGKTLILYNDSPAPVPGLDIRYDYFTGMPDLSLIGGAPSVHPGFGPNTRTVMQIKVRPAAQAAQVRLDHAAVAAALAARFRASQPPLVVPESALNPVYGTNNADHFIAIQDQSVTFTPLCATTTPPTCPVPAQPQTLSLGWKAIHELFDTDYGRMNSLLGVEIPLTTWLGQTTIPYTNFDPTTEFITDNQPQIWKITHNGVDTHTIHFHLLNVQIVNRVGWDGTIRPPDVNELGWKESVRMHPLEDIYVALQPVRQSLPWPLPDMKRPLDVTRPLGTRTQFTGVDINNQPIAVTNQVANFGWEYVWHCHLLGHEENDMLRAEVFIVPAEDPSNLVQVSRNGGTIRLSWLDNSKSAQKFTLQRATNPNFTSPTTYSVNAPATQPGLVTYTINNTQSSTTYWFRVRADKSFSSPALPGTTYPAYSNWSNVLQSGNAPQGTVTPNPIVFADQAPATTSAALTVTLSNTGTSNLRPTSFTFTGTNAADFALATNTAANRCVANQNLAPNGSCTLLVTFRPGAPGPRSASLRIASNDPFNPAQLVPVSGNGIGAATTVSPASLVFATQQRLVASAPQTVTFTNTGTTALNVVGAIALSGANAADYALTTTCGPSVAAGASCTVAVTFTPAAAGASSATLAIPTDAAVGTVTVPVTGTGMSAATGVTLTPSTPSPHTNGVPVTFTAKGTGPADIAPSAYQYRFTVNGTLVKDWSTTATWTLAGGSVGGTYDVVADVRTSPLVATPDATTTVSYVVTNPPAATVSLTPSAASPHAAGTAVTFAASASGSYGYQYRFFLDSGAGPVMVQDYGVGATWTMPASQAVGSYNVTVWVRTNLATTTFDQQASAAYQIVAFIPATGVTLTPSLASPQPLGTAVTFTAAGQGSSGYEYQFSLGGTVVQAWSATATWALPASQPAGVYAVSVSVRTSPLSTGDATASLSYQLGNLPATGVTLASSLTSPQPQGTSVTFTATGAGSTGYQYQFWVATGTGASVLVQDYGTAASWTLAAPVAGGYTVTVNVRTNPGVTFDAQTSLSFQIGNPPATGVTLTASTNPVSVGAPVTFTAAGSGSSGYQYQFWLQSGGTWSLAQDWSASATYTLTPAAAGAYSVNVWVRTNAGNVDAWTTATVDAVAAATGLALTSTPAGTQLLGTAVTFTAAAAGGTGTYQYQFDVSDGTTTTTVQPWGTAASWTMPATQPVGTYTVTASVRTNPNATTADAQASAVQVIANQPASGVALSTSLASPQHTGTAVTFSATATGGTGAYEYQFALSDGVTTTVVQPYGAAASFTLPATTAVGSYTVTVSVRTNAAATTPDAQASLAFVVDNQPAAGVTLASTPAGTQHLGTAVTFTAAATGGTGAYEYQFALSDGVTTTVVQPYGAGASWTMPATQPVGTYTVTASVRTNAAAATPDAQASVTQVIDNVPATGVTLASSLASPQRVGASVTFSAAATGGTGGNEYQFSVNAGGGDVVVQTWSALASYTLTPTVAGNYTVTVAVRTNGAATPDATTSVGYVFENVPATGVALASTPAGTQHLGTAVTFTATATGGTGAYEYEFALSDGVTTTVVQPWGAAASWTMPATQPVGTYTVTASVRTNAGAATPDAQASVTQVIDNVPATGVTLASSLASPQRVGTAVTFTATPVGGSGGYEYQFSVNAGAGDTVVQTWSTVASYALTPTAAGNYTVTVAVRTNGAATPDATASVGYVIENTPATGVTLVASPSSGATPETWPVGTAVTFTATGSGASGGYDYQFDLSDGTTTTTVQAYGNGATWSLPNTLVAGTPYTLTVSVRTTAAVTFDAQASLAFQLQ